MPGWRSLLLCVALANLADLDFVPGLLLGTPDRFHHGASHSLGAALLAGVLTALWRRRQARGWRLALWVFGLYLSHVLIDWMSLDSVAPIGVPLFWPLADTYFHSPAPLFLDIRRVAVLTWPVLRHNLLAVILEIAILAPFGLLLTLWRRCGSARSAALDRPPRRGQP